MRFRTDVGERLNPSKTQMGNGRKEHKAVTMTDRVTPQVCAVLTLRLPLKREPEEREGSLRAGVDSGESPCTALGQPAVPCSPSGLGSAGQGPLCVTVPSLPPPRALPDGL